MSSQPKEGQKAGSTSNLTSALNEAQSIIEAAEARAKELTIAAEQKLAEAAEQGYQEGFQQGIRDASVEAVRAIEGSGALADKLAEEAAKLALAISTEIVGEHVNVSPEAAKNIALAAIQESVIGENVSLVINPADKKALEKALPRLKEIAGRASLEIQTDENISRGGCLVRTDFGEVDASIEALVDSIKERLGVK